MKPYKILSKERLVDSPFCQIEKQLVELPDGSTTDWFISLLTDAVIVIPVTQLGEVVLQEQYKHGGGEIVTEFCAGMVDEGEAPEQAAHRELLEETGYQAERLTHLKTVFSNPTGSRMRYHYFLAEGAQKVSEPQLEAAEQIELLVLPSLEAARAHLLKPETLTTAGMIGALSLVENLWQTLKY